MQLRTLMMDELPAIIHRLSLRLWCGESGAKEVDLAEAVDEEKKEVAVDPFSSPPQDAVDSRGNVLDANEISSLSLDGGSEIHSLFSQKNLIRLATLTDSHRTLSLFTPSIRDAVFRAWAGPSERNESAGTSTPATPSLIRSHSSIGSTSTTYTFTNKGAEEGQMSSRPSLVSMQSATTGLSLGASRHARSHQRKKKTRVVNLRKPKTTDDISEFGDSETASVSAASEPVFSTRLAEEPEDNIITPPSTPSQRVRFQTGSTDLGASPRKSRTSTNRRPSLNLGGRTIPELAIIDSTPTKEMPEPSAPIFNRTHRPTYNASTFAPYPVEKSVAPPQCSTPHLSENTSAAGGIVEQAWVLKMAGEIARRAHDQKAAQDGFWSSTRSEREDTPPPAYEAKSL